MAKNLYIGAEGGVHRVKNLWIGANNIVNPVSKGWVGVNGAVCQFYQKLTTWNKYYVAYPSAGYTIASQNLGGYEISHESIYAYVINPNDSPTQNTGFDTSAGGWLKSSFTQIQLSQYTEWLNYDLYLLLDIDASRYSSGDYYTRLYYAYIGNGSVTWKPYYLYTPQYSQGSPAAGSYIGQVEAVEGTYPDNGMASDGYWYIKQ